MSRRRKAVRDSDTSPPASDARAASPRELLAVAALVGVLTFVVYLPSMRGGLVWDDEAHVTKPKLQSLDGLYRIWFELGATQQYYPLLHSAFWVEHRLWGDAPLGYHLTNVLLHVAAATLVYGLLRKLRIPGALLAAAIFALHPVHVESVAWISEQKNTLSAVFYLGAMWAYLDFDESRRRPWYWLALVLFVLGLLTKTVIATLPAALLVVFWWQRGELSWHRDVLPLAPFFVLGAVAGLLTAWVEQNLVGAEGADFEMSLIQRGLLASRVPWFYFSKLLWPTHLVFVYPRWKIDPAAWWQWLFPLAMLALLAVLWSVRGRWRAPLAAWLLFVGTLFPALGFLNVYPFQFSFVADHFQYLASLGILALVAAGAALAVPRLPRPGQTIARGVGLLVVGLLGFLTWQQCHVYADKITLYEATIAANPNCWMALNNLGNALAATRPQEAIELYRRALEVRPQYHDVHANLGVALGIVGRTDESIAELREAVRLQPNSSSARYSLGSTLVQAGHTDEGIAQLREVVRLKPDADRIRNNLGVMLFTAGRYREAIVEFEKALELKPDFAEARDNLNRARQASASPAKSPPADESRTPSPGRSEPAQDSQLDAGSNAN